MKLLYRDAGFDWGEAYPGASARDCNVLGIEENEWKQKNSTRNVYLT